MSNTRILQHDKAVVVGGSLSGLAAAQALADHFRQVTIIDRDHEAGQADFRTGAPQARHAHTLQPRAQAILERLFPGLGAELVAQGAVPVDPATETLFFEAGRWRRPARREARQTIYASRPMLEASLYRRVRALPNVVLKKDFSAEGLVLDGQGVKVAGVRLRGRGEHQGEELVEPASLVLDVSGRNSHAPQWLGELGFQPPEEWRVDAQVGYSSRTYRQPQGFNPDWKVLYVRPQPPDGRRGAMLMPVEGGLWMVTLLGVGEDYPPTDNSGFMRFARSLPGDKLYAAIREAEAENEPVGYRRTANVVRRYDKVPAMPGGFLVAGDAVFTLNPMYAQGMTAALIGVAALERQLRSAQSRSDAVAFSRDFQSTLSREVGRLFRTTVQHEWEWPATRLWDNTELVYASAWQPA